MMWHKGMSGNPKERPAGIGAVEMLRASIATHVPDIIEAMVTQSRLVGFGKLVAWVIAGRTGGRIGRGANGLQHPYAGAGHGMSLKQRVGKLEQHRGSGRFIHLTTYPNETVEEALARRSIVLTDEDFMLVFAGMEKKPESIE